MRVGGTSFTGGSVCVYVCWIYLGTASLYVRFMTTFLTQRIVALNEYELQNVDIYCAFLVHAKILINLISIKWEYNCQTHSYGHHNYDQ